MEQNKFYLITHERDNFDVTEFNTLLDARKEEKQFLEDYEYINTHMIIEGNLITPKEE